MKISSLQCAFSMLLQYSYFVVACETPLNPLWCLGATVPKTHVGWSLSQPFLLSVAGMHLKLSVRAWNSCWSFRVCIASVMALRNCMNRICSETHHFRTGDVIFLNFALTPPHLVPASFLLQRFVLQLLFCQLSLMKESSFKVAAALNSRC